MTEYCPTCHRAFRPSKYKDAGSASSAYRSWVSMKNRCLDPKHKSYRYYGAKGIGICTRWLSFENFFADMGERPKAHEIDRIDSAGDYTPTNCRWVTRQENNRNRRLPKGIKPVVWEGAVWTVGELSRHYGINIGTLGWRLRNGWAVSKALSEPADIRFSWRKKPSGNSVRLPA